MEIDDSHFKEVAALENDASLAVEALMRVVDEAKNRIVLTVLFVVRPGLYAS